MILLGHFPPCLLISCPIIWKDYNFWSCFHWSVHVCSTGMFNFACWMQWSKRWRWQWWWFCCWFPFGRCNLWDTWLYFCSTGINLISDSTTLMWLLGMVNIVAYLFLTLWVKEFLLSMCVPILRWFLCFFHNEACSSYCFEQVMVTDLSTNIKRQGAYDAYDVISSWSIISC